MKKIIALLLSVSVMTLPLQVFPHPPKKGKKPKNIILMIGDGTGLAQWCAAMAAQNQMLAVFSWASYVGLSITASANDYITDSAAGATALSTGQKTNNGMVAVAPDSSKLKTILELAEDKNMKTGLVSTCSIEHATPAGFYAHNVSRSNYVQIGNDLYNSGVDFAMSSGFNYLDSAKLIQAGYNFGFGKEALNRSSYPAKFIGFYDRNKHPPALQNGRDPNWLENASLLSIKQLNNKQGFFLMIEGSQIDWGGHDNDSNYVVTEALEFDSTINSVMQWAKNDGNTLVIVTADHETGGLSLVHRDTAQSNVPYMKFSTGEHTGIAVPVFAFGPGAEYFTGVYQNTEIFKKMCFLLNLKQ